MPSSERRGTRIAHVGIAVRSIGDLLPFCRDIHNLPDARLADSDGARIAGLEAGESLVELLEALLPVRAVLADPLGDVAKWLRSQPARPPLRLPLLRPRPYTKPHPAIIRACSAAASAGTPSVSRSRGPGK